MKKIVSSKIIASAIIMLSLSLTTLISCSEVIVDDISKREVTIISPADKLQSSKNNQLFWWNEIDKATQYNIQIVTPSFAAPDSILLDTTIEVDRFYYTLADGKYQWRIRAENEGYKTNYQTYKLTIVP